MIDGDSKEQPRRRPSLTRRIFRCLRLLVLTGILLGLASAVYLNKIGLPEFIKSRFKQQLQARGWEVEFSRLRLRWYRGIVAEDLQVHSATNRLAGPSLFIEEARCRIRWESLKQRRLDVTSVSMIHGRLIWILPGTNHLARALVLNDLQGDLQIRSKDQWELRNLQGQTLGMQFKLSGVVTNAASLRDLSSVRRRGPSVRGAREYWGRILQQAQLVQFAQLPEVTGSFNLDATDLKTLRADLRISAPGFSSPWAAGTNFLLSANLRAPGSDNYLVKADLRAQTRFLITRWGQADKLRVTAELVPSYTQVISSNAHVGVELDGLRTPWGQAPRLVAGARFLPCTTNQESFQAEVTAKVLNPASPWAHASTLDLSARAWLPSPQEWHFTATNADWITRLDNIPLDAVTTVSSVEARGLKADKATVTSHWQWPEIKLQVASSLYQGELFATTRLNVTNWDANFSGESSFDVHQLAPVLTTNSQRFLAKYSWEQPPKLQAEGRLTLPPDWMKRRVQWKDDVLPRLWLQGRFEVGPGGYRGATFTSAQSPFELTNEVWRLPRLKITRPEGTVDAEYSSRPQTRDFHWRLISSIDPAIARPLLEKDSQQKVFEMFQLTAMPLVQAEVWGRWGEVDRLGVMAEVQATNCGFRGEPVRYVRTTMAYTNRVLTFYEPKVLRDEGSGTAAGVMVDFTAKKLYLTNAFGNIDPHSVARVIGPRTAQAIEPYRFASPPTVRVNGVVDLQRKRYQEDLSFEVSGGVFDWRTFHLQQLAGNVHWIGRQLILTNVTGALRSGRLVGGARFNFDVPGKGAQYQFSSIVAEADLREVLQQFGAHSNKVEGRISGELVVTHALTSDPRSWNGAGHLQVRDGLLWDIPMFGIFSPILNAFVPGLGNSQATDAAASFLLTNGVFWTQDMEVRATAMWMLIRGTVGLDKTVDSTVEAELLRDVPGVGLVISRVFWPITKLFEYKVTGTIAQPKAEPLYVLPKVLLAPFQALKLFKFLVPEDKEKSPEIK